jgi:hypothetical protein
METVDLLFGQAVVEGLAANRNDVVGPYDPTLSVLAARRGDGSLHALMVHFACHPTILGADNRRISADFAGALRRALAPNAGGPVVLFVNGAARDVSPRFTRHAPDAGEVQRVGKALAAAANVALDQARPLQGLMRHGHVTVSLPSRRPRNGDSAGHGAEATERVVAATTDGQRRIQETRAQGAAMLAALTALPDAAIPSEARLDGWLLGDLGVAAIPGELFASLGRAIGAPESTLLLGYTNGYVGYLPDRAAYAAATYEALASPFAPGAGEDVASEAAALLARLRSESHGS